MIDKTFLKEYLLKPACYVVVFLVALFLLNKFTYFNFSLGSNQNTNSFEAIGAGKVTAVPNVAQTSFSITEKATTQEGARSAANVKQNQAITELTKLGIKKTDIKTSGFYVNPNYEVDAVSSGTESLIYPPRQQAQNGYVANVTTSVKADNVETLNNAIDALTKIGMNVGGVEYTFADREKYVLQAQNEAIENAKAQAVDWAKAAGIKLGKIVSIRNASDGMYGYDTFSESPAMSAKVATPNPDTSLEPGSNEITAKMGVTFYIK